ncbi:hypothetical protein METP2_02352 [Methanosarcinales archaeon]|nr:Ig-like domain-containing protein [Candidatus Methanoperedens sp.]CAG0987352.1 hypothetical protein METP2_02352 [Methanosarcinales archaeon]
MGNIRIFGKLLSILLAIILITAPISSALSAGYTRNNETSANDHNESIGNTKVTPGSESKDSSKTNNSDTRNNNAPEDDSKDTDEKPHNKLKNRLESLQPDFTSPLTLKQQAYGNLSSLNPVENKNNKDITKKLDKAKLYITKSVASGLWYDKNHLKPVQESDDNDDDDNNDNDSADKDENDKGPGIDIKTPVFKSEKTSAQNILEIISKSKDQLPDDDILIETLINLVQADRNIAQTAITDALQATSRNGDNPKHKEHKNIEKAQKDFDKAIEKIQKGEPIDAIEHFEDAWEHATSEVIRLDAAIKPVIVFDSIRGMYINRTTINLTGHVEDAAVYTLSSITLEVNGIPSTLNLTDGIFETALNLNEGKNHINATVIDNFGNTGTNNITLIVDTILPVISYSGADDGRYYNTSVSVTANMTDENPDTLIILVNGNPYTQNAPIIIEGTYRINITARDLAGNTADSSFTFHIDMTPPAIRIIKPVGSFISGTAAVNFTVTDISPVNTEVTADGSVPLTGIFDSTAYPDGVHFIMVDAVDAAGNAATETVSFIVDNTKPEVSILEPGNNEAIRGFREIIASAYDLYLKSVTLFINNRPVSDTVNHTFDTLNYSDGNYTISAQGIDLANNTGYGNISVIVDNTPPAVNITSPSNGSFVKQQIEVNANITETNPDITDVRIDSVNVSGTLPYLLNTLSYADGQHAIGVYLRDRAGNEASGIVDITIDNTRPEVNIISPVNASLVRGVINIAADIYDINPENTTLAINGIFVTNNSTYAWNTTGYTDGWHTITAMAVDMAGNTAQKEVWVQVDNTPPALSVSELNVYPTINNLEYQLLITTEADTNATVNNAPVALDNGSATYKTNVILGINDFIVTAIDRAGNSASWNKTILIDEDKLPDWYEINVTGTDPLNADSDSTKTTSNEAANMIPDDQEDFNKDGLTNLQEFRLGTNPFAGDSDSDGLTDWFEVFKTGTYPTSTDTDGNAITDANEDFDTDSLTNMQEQSLGTDPLNPDTDDDTLKDGYEINILKINSLNKDTDNDGLEDDSELRLSTNPLNPDSNRNGIFDGKESYTQTFKNSTAGVEAIINGVGDVGKSIVLAKDNSSALMSSLPGVVNTVDISTSSQVNSVSVKIYYNESILGSILESELKLFYYNETSNALELVADQGINTTGNYVWGNTNHLSIYGIATPRDWFNQWYVNWKIPGQIFKIGDRMRIKANVHNTGQGPASNVKVEFRENTQSGTLIGTTTIPSIATGSSALTSIEWTVKSGTTQICVKVDPANLIAEVSEGNNNACGDFSSNLDSDGDGLTDYEETNGMRVAFPNAFVKSYAGNAHSDNDGLTDGYEMGRIVYDPGNKLLYDSLATLYGWDKSLYDGYHYEYKADPMKTDTDGDRLNDKQELDAGTNPFKSEYSFLLEASLGYVLGDIGLGDPRHDNMAYLGGTIAAGLTPYVEWAATARDVVANAWHGDWFTAGVTLGTGLLSAFPATVVADEVPEMSAKLLKFVKAFPHKITEVGKYIVKVIPDHSIRLLDEIYQGAVTILKGSYGFSNDLVRKYAGEGIDIGKVKNGLEGLIIEHSGELSQKTAGTISKFDEPIKDIRFAGTGGEGADIVATMNDGRKIGREVTTIQPSIPIQSANDFTGVLKDTIAKKSKQLESTTEDIKELHIQVNKATEFANKETLLESIERAKGTLKANNRPYVINKVVLYDGTGNMLAIG